MTSRMNCVAVILGITASCVIGRTDAIGATETNTGGSRSSTVELPALFVPNLGQLGLNHRFAVHQSGMTVMLDERGIDVLTPASESGPQVPVDVLEHPAFVSAREKTKPLTWTRLAFVDSSPSVLMNGIGPRDTRVDFRRGDDPNRWALDVPTYEGVQYEGLYEGIDLRVYQNGGILEYDILVEPGADPALWIVRCSGATLSLDSEGGLIAQSEHGDLRQKAPHSYQLTSDGEKIEVPSSFAILDSHHYTIELGSYDKELPLVIDPGLAYSTYFGGAGRDSANKILRYNSKVVFCGESSSVTLPRNTDYFAPQNPSNNSPTLKPDTDFFVAVFDTDTETMEAISYFGGSDDDIAANLERDSAGNIWLTGSTRSKDFPVTANAFQTTYADNTDAFLLKLNMTTRRVEFASYLGGSDNDIGFAVHLDSASRATICGSTRSADFPSVAGSLDTTLSGLSDAFVTRFSADGTLLEYSTFIGGFGQETAFDFVFNAEDRPFVTGRTNSPNFPTTPGVYGPSHQGSYDTFVFSLTLDGSAFDFSTLVSAPRRDESHAIALDDDDNIYVTGVTLSPDFPTTPGVWDDTVNGGYDNYVFKIDSVGVNLLFSTLIGGADHDVPWDLVLDDDGAVHVVGQTNSPDYPITTLSTFKGFGDGFVTRLLPNGTALFYSDFIGGASLDINLGIALDMTNGQMFVVGQTYSRDFPTAGISPFDDRFNGNLDAFFMAIDP